MLLFQASRNSPWFTMMFLTMQAWSVGLTSVILAFADLFRMSCFAFHLASPRDCFQRMSFCVIIQASLPWYFLVPFSSRVAFTDSLWILFLLWQRRSFLFLFFSFFRVCHQFWITWPYQLFSHRWSLGIFLNFCFTLTRFGSPTSFVVGRGLDPA